MAGTLEISQTAVWMPAGWIFDRVLELLAEELQSADPALARILLDSRTEVTGYGDLRQLERNKFLLIAEAAEGAYKRVETMGPTAFRDPTFYPGFLKHFRMLRDLLRNDPRAMK